MPLWLPSEWPLLSSVATFGDQPVTCARTVTVGRHVPAGPLNNLWGTRRSTTRCRSPPVSITRQQGAPGVAGQSSLWHPFSSWSWSAVNCPVRAMFSMPAISATFRAVVGSPLQGRLCQPAPDRSRRAGIGLAARSWGTAATGGRPAGLLMDR